MKKEVALMIGIIPAAGVGERIQPLGCSKELLPVGSRLVGGVERPKAVSEYLVERMIAAGASQICMVISAEKTDIVKYYAERNYAAEIFYVVQQQPLGLCDALFRAEPFARQHDQVLIGLPDTIWFPENAYLPALAPNGTSAIWCCFPSMILRLLMRSSVTTLVCEGSPGQKGRCLIPIGYGAGSPFAVRPFTGSGCCGNPAIARTGIWGNF